MVFLPFSASGGPIPWLVAAPSKPSDPCFCPHISDADLPPPSHKDPVMTLGRQDGPGPSPIPSS